MASEISIISFVPAGFLSSLWALNTATPRLRMLITIIIGSIIYVLAPSWRKNWGPLKRFLLF